MEKAPTCPPFRRVFHIFSTHPAFHGNYTENKTDRRIHSGKAHLRLIHLCVFAIQREEFLVIPLLGNSAVLDENDDV